jgi:ParB-like chromosome segregation protein Spo0J
MSVATEPVFGIESNFGALDLEIERIRFGERARSGALDERHVALLMEVCDDWPPILVWHEDDRLLDGAHRVEAARRLGRTRIQAVRFVGSRDEAFIESVRQNVEHGLPLTRDDRRRAAVRVLADHAHWSDRRVGSVCGLSSKTVARLRGDDLAGPVGVMDGPNRRVGRDGKARPIQVGELRERIKRALEENPGGSLRAIAAVAGASPETVRTIRAQLADPVRTHAPALTGPQPLMVVPTGSDREDNAGNVTWTTDASLLTCGDGGDFVQWFEGTNISEDWCRFVGVVPVGRIYDVVDEARRRAAAWTSFASLLESRTR